MMRIVLLFFVVLNLGPKGAQAQSDAEVVWVQIEARPSLEAAQERVESYAQSLPDVAGFELQGGWYAIALGPYTRADAETVIQSYRNQGLIPSDSYIALSQTYGAQYWPTDDDTLGLGSLAARVVDQTPIDTVDNQNAASVAIGDQTLQPEEDTETPAQARRSESLLTAKERRDLQTALRWAGFYNSTIDGAFGRGTRNSMAAWQTANGLQATGILTTRQRAALIGQYNAILEGLDMQLVRDLDAGIEIRMPKALVAFERYEAPFAHYDAVSDFSARILLISQTGDRDTLKSLFDIMQTLTVVPLDGPRQLSRNSFSLVGRNSSFISETQVALVGDELKGFTLIWPTGDDARRTRVLQEMRDSFVRRTGVLDPAAGLPADQRVDLVSGLEIRKPVLSRSGFFVDASGAVVTTADAVQSCTRITLDEFYDATLTGVDTGRGIAVLKPKQSLAPPAIASFSVTPPRLQSEVAVAGYSFEGQLNAPSMTFGTLSDLRGLQGEPDVNRLAVDALPGDAGGPVMDSSGNVFGMLLPQPKGNRRLPEEVRFALTSEAIVAVLQNAGLVANTGASTTLDPLDIADRGVGMTVLVSCWE